MKRPVKRGGAEPTPVHQTSTSGGGGTVRTTGTPDWAVRAHGLEQQTLTLTENQQTFFGGLMKKDRETFAQ